MNAAAATSPARVRRAEAVDKRRRHEQARQISQPLVKRGEITFLRLSEDGEVLPESKVGDFLVVVVGVLRKDLQADVVQLVINMARNSQAKSVERGYLSKDALLDATDKCHDYILHYQKIEDIFARFDKKQDGFLSRTELWRALTDHEKKATRTVCGIVMRLTITEDDVTIVMKRSANRNGKIGRHEIIKAIETWEELANVKMMKREEESCCVIL